MLTKLKTLFLAALLAMLAMTVGCRTAWQDKFTQELPVMGHRNWIIVADSAYPAQSRAGIETIATGEEQIETITDVLKAVDGTRHVRPIIYLDRELQSVSEADAPGIDDYRRQLNLLLQKRVVNSIPHEELIAKLDEAARTFRVLILKTNLSLPYTSVFIELDCGYWSPEAEKRLRDKIRRAK